MNQQNNNDKSDSDSEQEMVTRHYGLVVHQALNFVINKQDLDDYIQSGLIGLLKAIRNYNPDRSKLSTFATVCIRNEILKFAKKQKRQKRHIPNTRPLYYTEDSRFWETHPDNLTDEEIYILKLKLENYTHKEIAEEICCSKNDIKQKMKKISNKLREANSNEKDKDTPMQ
jgi:RNA polymerase sigma factor (sigma-70 family)